LPGCRGSRAERASLRRFLRERSRRLTGRC
jgi:hypothetical protein